MKNWFTSPSCEELARKSTSDRMNEFSLFQRLSIRAHMLFCAGCQAYKKQVDALRDSFRASSRNKVDPEKVRALKKKIADRLGA